MFDMNRDGKVDCYERAMEFHFINSIVSEENNEVYDEDDEDERRELLEEAGLDPDDYDF